METYADRLLGTLSDGERQKVMLARALAQDTPLIIGAVCEYYGEPSGKFLLTEAAQSRAPYAHCAGSWRHFSTWQDGLK